MNRKQICSHIIVKIENNNVKVLNEFGNRYTILKLDNYKWASGKCEDWREIPVLEQRREK